MKKKKIVVLGLSHPFRGGISHYSTLLVRELRKKKNYEVKFISLIRQYPEILFPGKTQYDYSSDTIIEQNDRLVDSMNPVTWINTVLNVRKEKVDLVVIQWWHPFLAFSFGTIANLLSVISNIKVCFLCHNVIPHEHTLVDRFLLKYTFLYTKYFIVHSEEDKKKLLSLKADVLVKKNVHPTYSEFKKNRLYEKHSARCQLNLGTQKNIILFFGYVRPYKGLKYLIKAMSQLINKIDCILLIVGEFYEPKEDYTTLISELGLNKYIIIVDKYVKNEDVPIYFFSSDVVVLPYISASQSGIAQIAFGLNIPVITTNVGGLPEVVEDGKTGFIVKSKSHNELSKAIFKYYKYEYEKKMKDEIKRRKDIFSWTREIDNIDFFLNREH